MLASGILVNQESLSRSLEPSSGNVNMPQSPFQALKRRGVCNMDSSGLLEGPDLV